MTAFVITKNLASMRHEGVFFFFLMKSSYGLYYDLTEHMTAIL